jgi:hypothetical protein
VQVEEEEKKSVCFGVEVGELGSGKGKLGGGKEG